jgi:hypothetical protein
VTQILATVPRLTGRLKNHHESPPIFSIQVLQNNVRANTLGTFRLRGYLSTVHKTFWLSYDLGLKGDYEGLYRWLDSRAARECGDSVAYVRFEYKKNFVAELKKCLAENISTDAGTRFYAIYRRDDTRKFTGRFIMGNRRAAPWIGYAPATGPAQTDEP